MTKLPIGWVYHLDVVLPKLGFKHRLRSTIGIWQRKQKLLPKYKRVKRIREAPLSLSDISRYLSPSLFPPAYSLNIFVRCKNPLEQVRRKFAQHSYYPPGAEKRIYSRLVYLYEPWNIFLHRDKKGRI